MAERTLSAGFVGLQPLNPFYLNQRCCIARLLTCRIVRSLSCPKYVCARLHEPADHDHAVSLPTTLQNDTFYAPHAMLDNDECTPPLETAGAGGSGSASLTGGNGRGSGGEGSGDGSSGNSSSNDPEGALETALTSSGRVRENLPPEIRSLSADQLLAYLESTRSGLGRFLAQIWPGWRRRVAADPDFPFKVLMEETVGLGLAASGMIAARGKEILNELDFAICDIAVGGTLNFILVYLLTPSIAVAGVAKAPGMLERLPANLFAEGGHSLGARIAGFLYKGTLFAGCGFAGSLLGTFASQGLVTLRRKFAKSNDVASTKELPNIWANSAAWAGFMFVSSNPRYQTVAGIERVLFKFTPEAVAKIGSGALRTANNVLGGANWVVWARAIGLQARPQTSEILP